MIRQPTETDVRELLLSSGVRFTDKGAYYSIFCPFHDNKKTASASLYKDRWLFRCFGCDSSYSFQKLYEALKGKPWNEHGSFNMVPTPLKDTMANVSRQIYAIEEGSVTSVYDNAKALAYCRNRGINDNFIKYFDLQATDLCKFKKIERTDPTTIWQNRLLIPINFEGKPYNLEGRDYTYKQTPKCLYPKHCKMDICFNQSELNKERPLIVCEGIMDVHKIWSNVDKNVTCTFGVSLTEGQKDFLRDSPNLILFIDDDLAGHKSVSVFEKFMNHDFKVAFVPGTDPGGSTPVQISNALMNAISWVDFIMNETKLIDKSQKKSFSLTRPI